MMSVPFVAVRRVTSSAALGGEALLRTTRPWLIAWPITSAPCGSRPPRMRSFTERPRRLRSAAAETAISQRLSGSKRPILNHMCSAAAADLNLAEAAGSASMIASGGIPFGITIGFWPHSHIRNFMYRLTVVMVEANASAPQLMRWKPKVLLAFHSITTRSRSPR